MGELKKVEVRLIQDISVNISTISILSDHFQFESV
jgi:hypothetical protein